MVLLALAACVGASQTQTLLPAAASSYDYYSIGDLDAAAPAPREFGLMLMGGGDWAKGAFKWFNERTGHGRIVILRASGSDDLQNELFRDVGGLTAAETIVFHDRSAANDPRVLAIVAHADGIFIGGGDQSNYVRFWKGTPLSAALDAHVRSGRPLGGTSAGLAILGAYSYGAMDGGSLDSADGLANPTGPAVTLVSDFLHLRYLDQVITDSHFGARARLGRLIVFVARFAQQQQNTAITGIGIDESTALCVDSDGRGRVYTNVGGYAWLVRPQRFADVLEAGKPLEFHAVPVTGVGPASSINLRTFHVDHPAFNWLVDAVGGKVTHQEL